MNITVPELSPVEDSLFLTLCGRALDQRSSRPILGDRTADDIIRTIGYNTGRQPHARTGMRDIALRAKKLDQIVTQFTTQHPDAVVLDLGAGLDSRMIRLSPPTTVDWYDVDFPTVIGLRKQLLPDRTQAHQVAADLTESPDWLHDIPPHRPAVIIADGLLAFLPEEAFVNLLRRLVDHFGEGDIAFNGYTRFHVWALTHYGGTRSIAGVVANPGFDNPHQPEGWDGRIRLVEEILLTRAPEVSYYPVALRIWTRIASLSTSLSRRGTTVLHYEFGPELHQASQDAEVEKEEQ